MSLRLAIRDRLLSRPAVLAANIVGLVVLSRVLSATDFGLFALAAVAHQVAVSLADLGVKSQLLKRTTMDPRRHGEAFGLALVAAAAVAAGFLGIVWALPDDLAPPALDMAFCILAASVLIGPLDLLFNIPLMQGMRFGLISLVNVAGAWTRCAVSIAAALLGAGPAALAAGLLAEQLVSFVLFACARRNDAIPVPRMTGWRILIADGGRLGAGQVIRHMGQLGMMAAVTTFLGAATLGIYNRANQVVELFDRVFLSSIEPVVLPAFAQVIEQGHQPAAIYIKKVELLSSLTWPAFATIAILAGPLCTVILGPGWDQATIIVQLLALTGIARPFTQMSQTLLIALGQLRLGTRLDILHHITRTVIASAGAVFSLEAACIGMVIAQIISGIRHSRAFARATGYDKRQLHGVLLRSALLTTCAAGPAGLVYYLLADRSDIVILLAALCAGLAGFVCVAILTRNTLYFEAQRALRAILRKRHR